MTDETPIIMTDHVDLVSHWQLYDGHNKAGMAIEHEFRNLIDIALNRPIRDGVKRVAREVQQQMRTFMEREDLLNAGARDTEPDGVLVDRINEALGTEIGRW